MYIHAPCFDLDELARDNLHIHTSFSRCAKPEMTVENIFAEAARIGYRTIALTDHYNLKNVTSLIKSGKPDCIAHPLTAGYVRAFEDKTLVSQAITDNELGDIMTLAKEHEVAWELNIGNIYGDPEFSRRMWNIGRELGSCFNMGADAHLIKNIDFAPHMSEIKKIFGV